MPSTTQNVTQTRPESLRIHRDGPGRYTATIGPRDFTIRREEYEGAMTWIVREIINGAPVVWLTDDSYARLRDKLREEAGHPGISGIKFDRRRNAGRGRRRGQRAGFGRGRRAAVTPPDEDAPGVEEVETPSEVSSALIRGRGRRRVGNIVRHRGNIYGVATIAGEAVRVRAESPENPGESRWIVDEG